MKMQDLIDKMIREYSEEDRKRLEVVICDYDETASYGDGYTNYPVQYITLEKGDYEEVDGPGYVKDTEYVVIS